MSSELSLASLQVEGIKISLKKKKVIYWEREINCSL